MNNFETSIEFVLLCNCSCHFQIIPRSCYLVYTVRTCCVLHVCVTRDTCMCQLLHVLRVMYKDCLKDNCIHTYKISFEGVCKYGCV